MIPGITASARRLQSGGGGDLPSEIGQPFGGGFYAGDIQYPDGQWYKLIVADISADITGANSRWKTLNTNTPGTADKIDGWGNTQAMIAAGIGSHPAAGHCVNYRGGGNADWYMPSEDDMGVVYNNLGFNRPDCPPDFQTGGPQAFLSGWYWASTQYSNSSGWVRQFPGGTRSYSNKTNTAMRLRPVRRVPFSP